MPLSPSKQLARRLHSVAWAANKRALTRWGQPGRITTAQLKQSLKAAHFRCECCGSTDLSTLTVDHVIPLKHGGKNVIANVQWLCRQCNLKKGTNDDDYRPANREAGLPYLVFIRSAKS